MPMAASGESPETNYPESRVLIIMTGGTICMQPSADGLVPMTGFLENAMAPRPSFNDASDPVPLSAYKNGEKLILNSLRTPPTAYSRHVRYTILEFSPLLDSSSISSIGWTEIALTVKENYHLFDGFVVLHGTDSLAYSASALSFMMSDLGKPVILTGSQASIFALQSDAVDNLLGSLIVAGTFQIPEVCLFFHHTLFRGNRTTKVSASAFEAFDSPNCQPLAKVTSLGVDVNWTLVRRPTRIAEFHVTKYIDTAHVACLRIFPGIKPEMIDSVLHVPGLKGLILETFGMGNAPGGVDGSLTKVIKEAVERGIVIVNVSQCTNGFVSPLYAPGTALGRAGVVFGHDLTTEAALTKLGYLLAVQDLSFGDITEKMALSIRGESKYTEVLVHSLALLLQGSRCNLLQLFIFLKISTPGWTQIANRSCSDRNGETELLPPSRDSRLGRFAPHNRRGSFHITGLRNPARRARECSGDARGRRIQPPATTQGRLCRQHGDASCGDECEPGDHQRAAHARG